MTETIKMYGIPQIVRYDTPIELPSCMYQLKNIHMCTNGELAQNEVDRTGILRAQADVDITKKDNSTPKEMMDVIFRQERLLEKLEGLQKQMEMIREQLSISKLTTEAMVTTPKTGKTLNIKNLPNDLVITVNPTNPPFSLLLLQRLWANVLNLSVETFQHSTITSLNEKAQCFSKAIKSFASNENVPTVSVRLIWMEVGAHNLEINLGANHIMGECNWLRYLARLTNGLNYDENDYEVDGFIDLSHRILSAINKTSRAKLYQFVTKKLGKSTFLFGSHVNIADIALYSAIKQVAAANEINARISSWMQQCESL